MSAVNPLVLVVIAVAVALTVAFWVVWVRALWAMVKVGLFLGTAAVTAALAVWAWQSLTST